MTSSEGMRWRLWKSDMRWKGKTGYTSYREKDKDRALGRSYEWRNTREKMKIRNYEFCKVRTRIFLGNSHPLEI